MNEELWIIRCNWNGNKTPVVAGRQTGRQPHVITGACPLRSVIPHEGALAWIMPVRACNVFKIQLHIMIQL